MAINVFRYKYKADKISRNHGDMKPTRHQGKYNTMTFLRRLDLPNSIIKNETCNWNKNSFQHAIHKNVILSYLKQSMHGAVKIIYLD